MTQEEAFLAFDADLVSRILADPDYQKAKASGKFGNFIMSPQSTKIEPDHYTKLGTEYTVSLQVGMSPREVDPSTIADAIYEWLAFKKYGFNWSTEGARWRMADNIAQKIIREGTYKHLHEDKRTYFIDNAIVGAMPSLLENLTKTWEAKVIEPLKLFQK